MPLELEMTMVGALLFAVGAGACVLMARYWWKRGK